MTRKKEDEIMHYYAHMSIENPNLKTELEKARITIKKLIIDREKHKQPEKAGVG